jgi:hypothetical protein
MSLIAPQDSFNILCSEQSLGMQGGFAYAEMLRTVRDVIEERTGNTKACLLVASAP